MRLLLLSLAAVSLWAADLPKLTYSKSFPGSQPAYVAIAGSNPPIGPGKKV